MSHEKDTHSNEINPQIRLMSLSIRIHLRYKHAYSEYIHFLNELKQNEMFAYSQLRDTRLKTSQSM